jgi:2OG-Fe(II) oxygenase superfamily
MNIMTNGISTWKNFLNNEELSLVDVESEKYRWKQWTPPDGRPYENYPDVRLFWVKSLIESDNVRNLLSDKIENFLGKKIKVNHLFINARSHGMCGNFHTDVGKTLDGDYMTFVCYIHKKWRPEYGGHLIFEVNNEIISYWPEYNSALLFNSKIDHCVLEPTIHCRGFRTNLSMMFRLL